MSLESIYAFSGDLYANDGVFMCFKRFDDFWVDMEAVCVFSVRFFKFYGDLLAWETFWDGFPLHLYFFDVAKLSSAELAVGKCEWLSFAERAGEDFCAEDDRALVVEDVEEFKDAWNVWAELSAHAGMPGGQVAAKVAEEAVNDLLLVHGDAGLAGGGGSGGLHANPEGEHRRVLAVAALRLRSRQLDRLHRHRPEAHVAHRHRDAAPSPILRLVLALIHALGQQFPQRLQRSEA